MASLRITSPEALTPATRAVLPILAVQSWASEVYLAGSAALALYLGHRPVRDLDLMSATNRLTPPERRDLLGDLLAAAAGTTVETARDGYLYLRLPEAIGLRFFYYPYPLVAPEEEFSGLAVASALDLGLMKLAAIISRGSKRDFVDLYLLCRKLPLDLLFERAEEKFGHVGDFTLQALKGLADLAATVDEPMPQLAQPLAWEEVVAWVREEVRTRGRQAVGLR